MCRWFNSALGHQISRRRKALRANRPRWGNPPLATKFISLNQWVRSVGPVATPAAWSTGGPVHVLAPPSAIPPALSESAHALRRTTGSRRAFAGRRRHGYCIGGIQSGIRAQRPRAVAHIDVVLLPSPPPIPRHRPFRPWQEHARNGGVRRIALRVCRARRRRADETGARTRVHAGRLSRAHAHRDRHSAAARRRGTCRRTALRVRDLWPSPRAGRERDRCRGNRRSTG